MPAEGYWSFGDLTTAGPWMLGFMLGAFTIVGFESAANLAEETNDPETVVPRAMWQAVAGVRCARLPLHRRRHPGGRDPVALAESGTPIADVIDDTLGSVVATLLLVMVVLAIFACGLVIMMTGARLTWAMSRDERFPGWQRAAPDLADVPHAAEGHRRCHVVPRPDHPGDLLQDTNVLFTLFGAATLLPAVMYASTVVLYVVKRKPLPHSDKFDLGEWEVPIMVVAVVWLVFELALFRDAASPTRGSTSW